MELTTLILIIAITNVILVLMLVLAAREWQSFARQQNEVLGKLVDSVQRVNTRAEVIDAKLSSGVNQNPNE